MRKVTALLLLALLLLAFVPSAGARPLDAKDELKLKIYVHHPRPDKDAAKPARPPTCDVCIPTTNDNVSDYAAELYLPTGTWTYRVNYGSVPASVSNPQQVIARSFPGMVGCISRGPGSEPVVCESIDQGRKI